MPNIKLRKGTTQQWETLNPVLAVGEAGFEFDPIIGGLSEGQPNVEKGGRLKIGDGVTPWNSLNYVSFDGGNLDELSENESSTSSQAADCSSFIDCDPVNGFKYSHCEQMPGYHVHFDCQTCECVATPVPK